MGSAERGRLELRLLVPAIVLTAPFVLLVVGLLGLPADDPVPPLPVAIAQASAAPPDDPPEDVADPTPVATAPAAVETPAPLAPTPTPAPRTPLPTPTPREVWTGPAVFTFVALGVDQRSDREIPRTDTIVVGRVDLRVPSVSLISIPRDLVVEIPGYGLDRINTAYVYGEQFKEPGGGIGLLRQTIEKNFGIGVDHFGVVDFQCFRTAVDAVGGLTVNVPRAIVDPRYPTEDYGTKLVRFEAGPQRMDGDRALEYVRTRNADNDFHRIQRQQLVMAAFREQVLQLRALPALPTILAGCRNMRSDLSWRDYLALAASLHALEGNRVSFATVDERMVVDTVLATGAAVLLPRWEPIRTLFRERFADPGPPLVVGSPVPAWPAASPSPTPLVRPARVADSPGPPLAPPDDVLTAPGDAAGFAES